MRLDVPEQASDSVAKHEEHDKNNEEDEEREDRQPQVERQVIKRSSDQMVECFTDVSGRFKEELDKCHRYGLQPITRTDCNEARDDTPRGTSSRHANTKQQSHELTTLWTGRYINIDLAVIITQPVSVHLDRLLPGCRPFDNTPACVTRFLLHVV